VWSKDLWCLNQRFEQIRVHETRITSVRSSVNLRFWQTTIPILSEPVESKRLVSSVSDVHTSVKHVNWHFKQVFNPISVSSVRGFLWHFTAASSPFPPVVTLEDRKYQCILSRVTQRNLIAIYPLPLHVTRYWIYERAIKISWLSKLMPTIFHQQQRY